MTVLNPATEHWDAIYYTNPIPLSSRSLLAFALLFDRIHLPGLSIPQNRLDERERKEILERWRRPLPPGPQSAEMRPYQNLTLWAVEQPRLADFVVLPDTAGLGMVNELMPQALNLIDDTYGTGASQRLKAFMATESVSVPGLSDGVSAFTWPLYQARALQYAQQTSLPLISDDFRFVPPLPDHPTPSLSAKTLAQQLAVEAVALTLPQFQSVDPEVIPELRADIGDMARPFRNEMLKMTAELNSAIKQGEDEQDLKELSARIVQASVLPALQFLASELKKPLRPWYRTALDVTEASLSATASYATSLPELVVAWALFRGAKIASEYAQVYSDRKGRARSGLGYLLKVAAPQSDQRLSAWDRHDWRCSGNFDVPEPGHPLTPENQRALRALGEGWAYETVRRVWQDRTASYVNFLPPGRGHSPP